MPLFLQQEPCPLRFPTHFSGVHIDVYDDGQQKICWLLKKDRRVLLHDKFDCGALEIARLPPGRVLASCVIDPQTWLLVVESNLRSKRVLSIAQFIT